MTLKAPRYTLILRFFPQMYWFYKFLGDCYLMVILYNPVMPHSILVQKFFLFFFVRLTLPPCYILHRNFTPLKYALLKYSLFDWWSRNIYSILIWSYHSSNFNPQKSHPILKSVQFSLARLWSLI